jgi:signal transduction histidine kinase/CheY-like chemotaxis protein/HPt (histidine-containing phosphotransfer) domain-containing protein
MTELYRFLSLVETAECAVLALVATMRWFRRRDTAGAWMAATFVIISVALVVAQFFPQGGAQPPGWLVKGVLLAVVAFPYLLFRFMQSLGGAARWLKAGAGGLFAALVLVTLFLPTLRAGAPLAPFVMAYALLLIAQWALLCGTVAVRLWRAGHGQPPVTRQRMRTLAAGSGGLALSVALSFALSSATSGKNAGGPSAFQVVLLVVEMAIIPLFLAGFAPPQTLVRLWRGHEDENLQGALGALVSATDPEEVVTTLLPHIARMSGARRVELRDGAGGLLGSYGDGAGGLLGSYGDGAAPGGEPVTLPVPFGSLSVWGGPYAPYFGREDLAMLQNLGALTSLTLERCRLSAAERSALDAMENAQRLAHVGSWRRDLRTGELSWSPEMFRIHGLDPASFRPTVDSVRALCAPQDRERVIQENGAALSGDGELDVTYRIVRPDGQPRTLHGLGQVLTDASGTPASAIGTVQDVTDQHRLEFEIRAARDEALEASRHKSEFLANMSHEIRTPMNGVLGMAQLLLGDEVDPVKRRRLLTLMESGRTLLSLINDVLDFSKVEAGKLEIEHRDFDLLVTLEGVVGLLSSPAQDKGLRLSLELGASPPGWVRGDQLRIHQVLVNLLANAVKFTERGLVTLTCSSPAPGQVRFAVADTGIGIDPAARQTILEPFAQADASTTRRFGGSGLGLAICRRLVGLMGGELDFASEPGAGSTFFFEVPLPAVSPPVLPEPGPVGPEDGLLAPRLGAVVLLADDAEVNREVGAGLLVRAGYRVETVDSGRAALEAVRRQRYDAVLMDCLMPVMDGYEATRRIRELEGAGRRTPVIALTAAAMTADRERCLAAGMDDYLSKPFDAGVLVATVARWAMPAPSLAAVPAGVTPPAAGDGPTGEGSGDNRAGLLPVAAERSGPGGAGAGAAAAEVGSVRVGSGDQALIHQLQNLRGTLSPDAFGRMCASIVRTVPELLGELQLAAVGGDAGAVAALAHKLRGIARTIGAVDLGRMAGDLEAAPAGSPAAGAALDGMEDEFSRVRRLVSAWLPGGGEAAGLPVGPIAGPR